MKSKRLWLIVSGLLVLLAIGGCSMFHKETLTKEQQDNVVRWIVRGYNVKSVEFTQFTKDGKTGMYLLSFRLDEDKQYETTISIRQIDEFNESNGILGLNPVKRFQNLERSEDLSENYKIDLSKINIVYLGGD